MRTIKVIDLVNIGVSSMLRDRMSKEQMECARVKLNGKYLCTFRNLMDANDRMCYGDLVYNNRIFVGRLEYAGQEINIVTEV